MLQFSLEQTVSQTTTITPQLQQAIKLLQLNNMDLCDYAEEMADENPFLVVNVDKERIRSQSKSEDNFYINKMRDSISAGSTSDDDYYVKEIKDREISLSKHIENFIQSTFTQELDKQIAIEICNYLEPTGWLNVSLDQLCEQLEHENDAIYGVLKLLRQIYSFHKKTTLQTLETLFL